MPIYDRSDLVEAAKLPFILNARKRDQVLLVFDRATHPEIRWSLLRACEELGHRFSSLDWTPDEPGFTQAARSTIQLADICAMATSAPIVHMESVQHAARHGTRLIYLDEMTPDLLISCGNETDYKRIQSRALRIRPVFDRGQKLTVATSDESSLSASIAGQKSFYSMGRFVRHPVTGVFRCSFPDGEVGIAPVEDTANGTLHINGSIQGIGKVSEPVVLFIEHSRIVRVDGGKEAKDLSIRLQQYEDENSYYCPSEVSLGLNDRLHHLRGVLRSDKKLLGSMHVSIGDNTADGGTNRSKTFITAVSLQCTVTVDNTVLLANGHLEQPG